MEIGDVGVGRRWEKIQIWTMMEDGGDQREWKTAMEDSGGGRLSAARED